MLGNPPDPGVAAGKCSAVLAAMLVWSSLPYIFSGGELKKDRNVVECCAFVGISAPIGTSATPTMVAHGACARPRHHAM